MRELCSSVSATSTSSNIDQLLIKCEKKITLIKNATLHEPEIRKQSNKWIAGFIKYIEYKLHDNNSPKTRWKKLKVYHCSLCTIDEEVLAVAVWIYGKHC